MTALVLLSVNVAMPRLLATIQGEEIYSGIAKRPVASEAVMVRTTAIDGDGQADLEVHGGIDKAVYAYPAANWPWWVSEKHLACVPGIFGENLTLGGADESDVHIGDRFAWGEALLEISQPRAPCFKLGLHTARADVAPAMTLSGRCGWYFRVLREGAAPVQGELERVLESDGPSVRDAFVAVFSPRPDMALLRRIHASPALSAAWRKQVAKKSRGFGA
jgi:MOSC domain-containing protein YiiM